MKDTQCRRRRQHNKLSFLIKGTMVGLMGMAVRQELIKPKEQRTWHGSLFGWLPYDFRRPTMQRVRDTFWAPTDPRLFMPRVYGLGWDINFGRLFTILGWRRHGVDRP